MKITTEYLEQYVKNIYKVDNINIMDSSDRNQVFDIYCNDKSFNMSIEVKERFFSAGNKKFMDMNDILIELIQHWYTFGQDINNSIVNDITSGSKINTSIGWFYKCNADRLLYIRWYENTIHDIYDIDFKPFKNWLLDRMNKYQLQYCDLSTKTVNLIVPIYDIPDIMIKRITIKEN